MNLTPSNYIKGLYILLFTASSILSLIKPSTHSVVIAGLSLVGFIAFELISQLKRPDVPDLSKKVAELEHKNAQLESQFQEIRDNISVGSLANVLKRR